MGKMAYLRVTLLTPALFETRIVEINVCGDPVWYSDKEKQS